MTKNTPQKKVRFKSLDITLENEKKMRHYSILHIKEQQREGPQ